MSFFQSSVPFKRLSTSFIHARRKNAFQTRYFKAFFKYKYEKTTKLKSRWYFFIWKANCVFGTGDALIYKVEVFENAHIVVTA